MTPKAEYKPRKSHNVHDRPLKGGTKECMIYNNSNAMWSSLQPLIEYKWKE